MNAHPIIDLPERGSLLTRMVNQSADIGGIYSLSYNEAVIHTTDFYLAQHGGIPRGGWLLAAACDQVDDTYVLEDEEVLLLRVKEIAPLPQQRELTEGRVAVVRDAHASGVGYGAMLDVHTRSEHEQAAYAADVIGVFYTEPDTGRTLFGSELDNVWASARYRVFMPSAKALSWIGSYPKRARSIQLGNVRFSSTTRNATKHGRDQAAVKVNIEDFIGKKAGILGMTRVGKALPLTVEIPVPVSERHPGGLARVGDINVGDFVYTPDDRPVEVIDLSPVATREVFRLHFDDGRYADASDDHVWEIVNPDTPRPPRSTIHHAETGGSVGDWASLTGIARLIGAELSDLETMVGIVGLDSVNLVDNSLYPAAETRFRYAEWVNRGHLPLLRTSRGIVQMLDAGIEVRLTGAGDGPAIRVVDATSLGLDEVRCLSVNSPPGMFLTESGIPTHNSNSIKTLVTAVYRHAAEEGVRIGQIIFDPQGEYAKVNHQDGTGLRLLGDESQVRIYTAAPTPGDNQERPLRLNFYETDLFDVAWDMVVGAMEGADANYVRAFRSADMERPDPNDHRALTHWGRGYMAFYGLLYRAGYRGAFARNASLSFSMKDDAAHEFNKANPSFALSGGSGTYSVSTPEQAAEVVNWVNEMIGAWEKAKKRASEGRKDVEDDEAQAAHLGDLIGKWSESDQFVAVADVFKYAKGRGIAGLRELREFHDPSGRGDVNEMVWDDMVNGRLVIIDLSIGSSTVTKTMSERLVTALVNKASGRFRDGLPPVPFQVVVEEAHNLFERGRNANDDPWVRMSKEAAKYEIGLMYATQEVTSVDQRILSNTANWIIAHLNSDTEIRELAKYYDFGSFGDSIKRAEDRGYVRMKTLSSPYIVPTQVLKFDHNMINEARAAAGLPPI